MYLPLSCYAYGIPFTAAMFVVGLAVGALAERSAQSADDALLVSIRHWTGISGEVLLLVFLFIAVWQLVTFAFPMVLSATCGCGTLGWAPMRRSAATAWESCPTAASWAGRRRRRRRRRRRGRGGSRASSPRPGPSPATTTRALCSRRTAPSLGRVAAVRASTS